MGETQYLDIRDFLPLFKTPKPIEFCVNIDEDIWFEGRLVGIDLLDNMLKIAPIMKGHDESEENFYAKWHRLYFQLNKHHERVYYVRFKDKS